MTHHASLVSGRGIGSPGTGRRLAIHRMLAVKVDSVPLGSSSSARPLEKVVRRSYGAPSEELANFVERVGESVVEEVVPYRKRHTIGRRVSRFAVVSVVVLVLGLGTAMAGVAQVLPHYRLGELVVSVRRPVIEAVGTLRRVTDDDIEAYGARTLDEALELLPGLDVRAGGEGVPRINVRGFRPRHVLLLLDGIPFNTAFDGQADPSLIPVENIAMIKMTAGTGSVLYGEGGLGGVINIITRQGAPRTSGTLTVEAGERDSWLGKGTLSGQAGPVEYFASGSGYTTSGFSSVSVSPTNDGDAARTVRANSDGQRLNGFGNLELSAGERLRLGLIMSGFSGRYGRPPGVIDNSDDPFARNPTFERVDDYDGFSGQLAGSYELTQRLDLRSWAFVHSYDELENRYDDSTYTSMDDPTVRGTYRRETGTTLTGVALQTEYDAGGLGRVTTAISAQRDDWDLDLVIRDVREGGGSFGTRTVRDSRRLQRFMAAAEYQVRPSAQLGLVAGYAHHWLDKDSGAGDDAGSLVVGAYYDLGNHMRARASFARKVRFPTIRQLYDEDGGNPDLQTERSFNYELGIERRFAGQSAVALTLYRRDVREYIERPTQGAQFENYDRYRFQGLELSAETRFRPDLFLRAGYSLMDTEDRSPGAAREELQYRPRHKFTLEGRKRFHFGLRPSLSILHIADQVFYSRREPVEQRQLNDYTLVDLRLAQSLRQAPAEIYLGVDNLLDEAYEEAYGFPQARRTLYGGISLRF